MHLIWIDVIKVLKGIFWVKLALLYVFGSLNFAEQVIWTPFCEPQVFGTVFLPATQKVRPPLGLGIEGLKKR